LISRYPVQVSGLWPSPLRSDFFRSRRDVVKEVGIREGFSVLDFGCGPASYVKAVAELVGKSGKIYALDINPLARAMQSRTTV
jgi:ubiquinone/menaquinone biosynthesis C-methylase UbiE